VPTGGTLQILIRRFVRSAQGRGTLYGGPIYLKGDGAWFSFGYGLDRNEVVLRAHLAHEPTRGHVHEAVVPLLVHVDVGHVTEEAAP
jgi:hypothetical protein